MGNNNKGENGPIEFLIADFKDTSEKLESTDKKIQFVIQIYTGILGAIISSSLYIFIQHFCFIEENKEIFLPIIIFIYILLFAFTVTIYIYNLQGNNMHSIYISRLNFLRKIIYEEYNFSKAKDFDYFYIDTKPRKVGMGKTVTYYLAFVINLFISIPLFFLLYKLLYVELNAFPLYVAIAILLCCINIGLIKFHIFLSEYFRKKTEDAIEELSKRKTWA